MASFESKSLPDPSRACSDTKDRAAPEILRTAVFSLQSPDGNGGEAILHIKSNCSGTIFFKLLF